MPNRILKESICTSCEVDQLTPHEEIFWYRLLVQCDDYGRMDARPGVLLGRCFPLRLHKLSTNDIIGYLKKLKTVGLIQVYAVDSKEYLRVVKWEAHQQIRARRSKFPSPDIIPPSSDQHMKSSDINGNHLISDVTVIQSNPNPNPESPLSIDKGVDEPTPQCSSSLSPDNQSFDEIKKRLEDSPNKVSFLIDQFKRLHPKAPHEDYENVSRLGKILNEQFHRDHGYLLQVIWESSTRSINGSHLSYIENWKKREKPHRTQQENDDDREKYVRGKYGHMVMR